MQFKTIFNKPQLKKVYKRQITFNGFINRIIGVLNKTLFTMTNNKIKFKTVKTNQNSKKNYKREITFR